MKPEKFYPDTIKKALQQDPPGEWMPYVPEGCIRLSSGYPDPALVPSQQLKGAVSTLLDEEQDLPLHYIGSPRIDSLKAFILARQEERGFPAKEEDVLITSGACQAIDLIARILLDESSVVVVEAPTYMEALEIFKNYTNQIISIPIDKKGMQVEELAKLLATRQEQGLPKPKLVYTIPTFQNPTGTTMSVERRMQLLALAEQYDFLVLEDDAYGELAFYQSPKALKALDQNERVFYVGSLSKVVAPGMRIGWISAASEFIQTLSWFKKDLDHPFSHASMSALLETINYKDRLHQLNNRYQEKCQVMLKALETYLPDSVTWYIPKGGYFVWVRIPGSDTSKLLTKASQAGVSYLPGEFFFMNQEEGKEYLRLSFSYESEGQIEKGIKLLGSIL
ncbi:aminotransferase-like domain-containing protein [Sutcliffiella rhizosphaerae]|uniref:2-aminoadipate transaminase n=1 Tax=Sutcliffiella rhizosphaerae TaxID=2880967 RepID=A0ABM8YRC2_9BACI|nr:PLP-dependent aminotransferase family protein [Sutcliffiella rhizosphaerae]CAG9622506.1 2-aminoadipate transaminase [Sutcliffiella rhizosphaerae]